MSHSLERMLYIYGARARMYGDDRSIWILTRLHYIRTALGRMG